MLLFLVFFQLQPVKSAPEDVFLMLPTIGNQGELIYPGNKELFVWNDKATSYPVKHTVRYYFYNGTYFWLTNGLDSTILDASGDLITTFSGLYFLQGGFSQPIASIHYSLDGYLGKLYPPTCSVLDVLPGKSVAIESTLDFAKATPKMREYGYQFKRVWPIYTLGVWYVVDQLEPRIRLYDDSDILREIKQGWTTPDNEIRSVLLPLRKYLGMPGQLKDHLPVVSSEIEGKRFVIKWWDSLPLIVGFGAIEGNRYMLAYRIPTASGFHLGIQLLGPAPKFELLGSLLEIPELQTHDEKSSAYNVAGWHDNAVVLFWPNVQPDGGMKPTVCSYTYDGSRWIKKLR